MLSMYVRYGHSLSISHIHIMGMLHIGHIQNTRWKSLIFLQSYNRYIQANYGLESKSSWSRHIDSPLTNQLQWKRPLKKGLPDICLAWKEQWQSISWRQRRNYQMFLLFPIIQASNFLIYVMTHVYFFLIFSVVSFKCTFFYLSKRVWTDLMHINLCRLFNTKVILLVEQKWYDLTHSLDDKEGW